MEQRKLYFQRLAAAILILLLAAISIWLIRFRNISEIEEINSVDRIAAISLSDGSSILLNSGSSIQYQQKGFRKSREVILKGEAFFEVEKAHNKPFIIYLHSTRVRVVGTTFNIDTRDQNRVSVSVLSGEVLFSDSNNPENKVTLKAGQQAFFNDSTKTFATDSLKSDNFLFWKTGELSYRKAKLEQVFTELGRYFNANIKVEDENLMNLELTTTFEQQELYDILDELTLLFDLSIYTKNDTIYIDKMNK